MPSPARSIVTNVMSSSCTPVVSDDEVELSEAEGKRLVEAGVAIAPQAERRPSIGSRSNLTDCSANHDMDAGESWVSEP